MNDEAQTGGTDESAPDSFTRAYARSRDWLAAHYLDMELAELHYTAYEAANQVVRFGA